MCSVWEGRQKPRRKGAWRGAKKRVWDGGSRRDDRQGIPKHIETGDFFSSLGGGVSSNVPWGHGDGRGWIGRSKEWSQKTESEKKSSQEHKINENKRP